MSKTLHNLIQAYLGESQARNRYTFYASQAKKEWFEQIAEIFSTVAEQEKKHWKTFYEFIVKLNKDSETPTDIKLNADLDIAVRLWTTAENLRDSIRLENDEFANLYPKFADEAEAEWYTEIATKWRAIAHAEQHHRMNFEKLLALVESGTYFKERWIQTRVCRECWYMVISETAPTICPSCDHPQAYFEKLQNDF